MGDVLREPQKNVLKSVAFHSGSLTPLTDMWVRRVDNALPDRADKATMAAVQKVRPGRTPFLSAPLPPGQYVATTWSRSYGRWSSSPFTVRHGRMDSA